MRQMVSERVERVAHKHQRSKEGTYGYLVRPLTLVLGWTVVIIGVVTIPLPGQGWLTTFFGVGILSLEQKWAKNLLGWGVSLYDRFFAWFHRQSPLTRIVLVGLLILIIWVVFLASTYAVWRAGSLDILSPYAAQIGLER